MGLVEGFPVNLDSAPRTNLGAHEAYFAVNVEEGRVHAEIYAVVRAVIYADGALAVQSEEGITGILGSDTDMVIGAESTDGASPLTGLVDDVRIWSYPLTALDIALLYTDFNPGEKVCINQDDPWRELDVVGEPGESSYCRIDIDDFAELASVWMMCNIVPDCLP